ncbi:hypothetical protein TSAR_015267 [Trichomalopsis sarcophagae]|uniref:Uncharacterized protein n=1 Tax=Trichomalopsis sarcophagae TaxID=543379 RepID=A0A232EHI8_9HYME|nr:hypothetical protein TSAR_015267 [Trichomalopsis sarcophagae]
MLDCLESGAGISICDECKAKVKSVSTLNNHKVTIVSKPATAVENIHSTDIETSSNEISNVNNESVDEGIYSTDSNEIAIEPYNSVPEETINVIYVTTEDQTLDRYNEQMTSHEYKDHSNSTFLDEELSNSLSNVISDGITFQASTPILNNPKVCGECKPKVKSVSTLNNHRVTIVSKPATAVENSHSTDIETSSNEISNVNNESVDEGIYSTDSNEIAIEPYNSVPEETINVIYVTTEDQTLDCYNDQMTSHEYKDHSNSTFLDEELSNSLSNVISDGITFQASTPILNNPKELELSNTLSFEDSVVSLVLEENVQRKYDTDQAQRTTDYPNSINNILINRKHFY